MYPIGLVELFWGLAGILFFGIALYYIVQERIEHNRRGGDDDATAATSESPTSRTERVSVGDLLRC